MFSWVVRHIYCCLTCWSVIWLIRYNYLFHIILKTRRCFYSLHQICPCSWAGFLVLEPVGIFSRPLRDVSESFIITLINEVIPLKWGSYGAFAKINSLSVLERGKWRVCVALRLHQLTSNKHCMSNNQQLTKSQWGLFRLMRLSLMLNSHVERTAVMKTSHWRYSENMEEKQAQTEGKYGADADIHMDKS